MNARDVDGQTALTYACKFGRTDVVKLTLDDSTKRNIDLNVRGKLMDACISEHKDVVKLLLDYSKTLRNTK